MKCTHYMTKIFLLIAEQKLLPVCVLLVTVCPVALIWNKICCCRTDYKYYSIGVEHFPLLKISTPVHEQLTS